MSDLMAKVSQGRQYRNIKEIRTAERAEGEEKNYPNAGKLFVVKPGVKGRKCNYFKNGK